MKMDQLSFTPTDVGRGSPTIVEYSEYEVTFDKFDKVFTPTSAAYKTLLKEHKRYPEEIREASFDYTNLFGRTLTDIKTTGFFDCSDLAKSRKIYPRRGHTIRLWERSTSDPRTITTSILKVTSENANHVLTVKDVSPKT